MSDKDEALKQAQDWYDSGHEDPDEFTEMIKQVIALAEQPAQQQEPVAWLYPEGLEALQSGKCWTAYGTKQDDNCNIPVYLNAAVAPKVEPAKAECGGFDSHPAAPSVATPLVQEPFGYFQYSMSMDAWVQNRDSNKGVAFYTTPPAAPVHEPVITDDLPKGFIPLQRRNGQLVYAACMDFNARHYKWLMRKHPNGHWVSERKLEDWEVMQVEDQDHYGIIQEAEATPPAGEKK